MSTTTFSRRHALGLAALVTGATTIAACGEDEDVQSAAGTEATKIKVGYIADYNGASLMAIANDQDLWSTHGLEAELSTFTNGPLQIQALGTKDLDFGYIGSGAMWLPASGKAMVLSLNSTSNADRVIAQPGITSIKDLAGKKVGVPEGTSGDLILQLALEKGGMTLDDIEKVAMDPTTVVSAFSAGQIDAAGIWYPLLGTIKEQVPDLVELAKDEDFKDTMAFPSASVMRTDIDDDTALKMAKVLREAIDFRAHNQDKTIELTAALIKADPATLKSDADYANYYDSAQLQELTDDGTIVTWLNALAEFYVKAEKLTDPADASQWYASEFFTQAGEGGTK
ncbi:aliphatic sulfonate ABC transporter substrate-binding protein [Actinomyces respiraculi]|uniref:aliphatic sulfonate ABC transporter substrate-binding protein n=1 Tax=Actinomyces respiraculi TaxID=2744574 RepID=UPI00141FD850|nr:aliphatic sulfonate ABC transporter substrate-binding protein [Actinomyces respiraculi]